MKYQTRQCRIKNGWAQNAQAGFTLIELIIALAIGVIVMTQAIPSFLSTIRDSHLTTETNKLVADINIARSEAIKRGVNVIVCSSADPNLFDGGDHDPDCGGANDWDTGWLVFADNDGNGSYSLDDDGDGALIRIGEGPTSGSTVNFTTASTTIPFSPDGLLVDATAKAITICDERGDSSKRQVLISATGRPRLDKTAGAC